MTSSYHSGELAVQARAGVLAAAMRVGGIVQPTLRPTVRSFLAAQRLVVVGSRDADGQVWASPLTGAPGFLVTPDDRTVLIGARPPAGDPLRENLATEAPAGMLAIDLATRRRLRVNGTAALRRDGTVALHVEQVYGNCPKYIQARHVEGPLAATDESMPVRRSAELSETQRAWIAAADTFFIATLHPTGGADASHRGGSPGFVRLDGDDVLVFPDYVGNNMFNTLGNIAENPSTGLLFVDFERGATLQLTGTAAIVWDPERVRRFPGAQRLTEFRLVEAIENPRGNPLRWRLVEYSPFNPT